MERLTRGWLRRSAAVSFLVLAAVGCNQGPGRGVVSGKVLLDGKPLLGGTVSFVSSVPGTPTVFAAINESGSYGPVELPAGEIQVAVDNRSLAPPPPRGNFDPTTQMRNVSPELRKRSAEAARQRSQTPPEAPAPAGKYVPILEKYYLVESSGLKFTVERGEHQEDIKLESKP